MEYPSRCSEVVSQCVTSSDDLGCCGWNQLDAAELAARGMFFSIGGIQCRCCCDCTALLLSSFSPNSIVGVEGCCWRLFLSNIRAASRLPTMSSYDLASPVSSPADCRHDPAGRPRGRRLHQMNSKIVGVCLGGSLLSVRCRRSRAESAPKSAPLRLPRRGSLRYSEAAQIFRVQQSWLRAVLFSIGGTPQSLWRLYRVAAALLA